MNTIDTKAIRDAIDKMTPIERERCARALNVLGYRLYRISEPLSKLVYSLAHHANYVIPQQKDADIAADPRA